jgi:hypothetical protein
VGGSNKGSDLFRILATVWTLEKRVGINPGWLYPEDCLSHIPRLQATGKDEGSPGVRSQGSALSPVVLLAGSSFGSGLGIIGVRDKGIDPGCEGFGIPNKPGQGMLSNDQALDNSKVWTALAEGLQLGEGDRSMKLNPLDTEFPRLCCESCCLVKIGDPAYLAGPVAGDGCSGWKIDVFLIDRQVQGDADKIGPRLEDEVGFLKVVSARYLYKWKLHQRAVLKKGLDLLIGSANLG